MRLNEFTAPVAENTLKDIAKIGIKRMSSKIGTPVMEIQNLPSEMTIKADKIIENRRPKGEILIPKSSATPAQNRGIRLT